MPIPMYTTEALIVSGRIPIHYGKMLLKRCPIDNYPIYRNIELTRAKCGNPKCKGHMKHKADDLLKYLGVSGIGPKTCFNIIAENGLENHFEILRFVFKDKPALQLWEIAMFCYVDGISTEWENILAGYASFDEFYEKENPQGIIKYSRNILTKAEAYFYVLPPLSRDCWEVMITGSINGYKNRDEFVNDCNTRYGMTIRTKKVGQKQSADYLICDNKESLLELMAVGQGSKKAKAASKGMIYHDLKVVTAGEYALMLDRAVKRKLGK